MSTYLVAYVISDFTSDPINEDPVTDTTLHRVYGTSKNVPSNSKFALEAGEKILNSLEKYTSIPYEISKIDQVGIPDFNFVAMENWGLVTYIERDLYYNATLDPPSHHETVATLIAHEFAHQWFGNLVTLDWWTFNWLNEGFAQLFENIIVDDAFPGVYNRMKYFNTRTLQNVMQSDATDSTRKMNTEPTETDRIMELFDNIAYNKGKFVLNLTFIVY